MNLAYLRPAGKFADIQAALRAFLLHHGKEAQPWMYEMLAVALVMNKGREADVNAALNYAADLAVRNRRPHELTRVADTLAIHGQNDRAGQLLDLATAIDPGNPTPAIMSLSLAERTKDPARMAAAVEHLLSLGWPDTDDAWRTETRQRVEALAKVLREDGRQDEARSLLERLEESEPRDLVVRLRWAGDADLSLLVEEPLGATARVATPRTVFGGAIVTNGFGARPEELYVCPRAFAGRYTIRVEAIENNPDDPARDITLEIITHEGTPDERIQTRSISLTDTEPVTVDLAQGRRHKVLPYQAPPTPTPEQPLMATPGPAAIPTPESPPGSPDTLPGPSFTPKDAADALRTPSGRPGAGAVPPR